MLVPIAMRSTLADRLHSRSEVKSVTNFAIRADIKLTM